MAADERKLSRMGTKAEAAQKATRRRSVQYAAGVVADWASVDGVSLGRAVAAIARDGGALRLGYTRDGGAYAIGFYDGDDKHTEYVSPNDDINEFLKGIEHDYARED
jgi:hypothetical protein